MVAQLFHRAPQRARPASPLLAYLAGDFADAIAARLAVALAGGDFACAVLAQASMAAAAGRTQTRVPVLTSPELALRALLS